MDAVVMIIRVWALYHRSRLILCALLVLYVTEVILILISCVMLSTQSTPVGM